jgi:hypothetical protein
MVRLHEILALTVVVRGCVGRVGCMSERREVALKKQLSRAVQSTSVKDANIARMSYDSNGLGVQAEEEEVPGDLTHLSPDEQQRRIKQRAFLMLGGGTLLLLLFTSPMVDAMSELGTRTVRIFRVCVECVNNGISHSADDMLYLIRDLFAVY